MMRAPWLVFGVGNPSRGDDALGPLFIERAGLALAAEIARGSIELLTDFQLQPEHALDLEGRERVWFVDASVSAPAPFAHAAIEARRHGVPSTHAMSPEALLDAAHRIGGAVPEAWVLAIRADRFELGEPLSERAAVHLDAALAFLVSRVRAGDDPSPPDNVVGRRLEIEGTVQGVGFRPWVARTARALGVRGEVRNSPRGVVIEAFGSAAELDALVRAIGERPPANARVFAVCSTSFSAEAAPGAFTIAPSSEQGSVRGSLPPDFATCDACLRDVDDAHDRHCAYVFTSCAECGPRFTIARSLPYDRATTTMARFAPCDACSAEYNEPTDRRYHAQTIACPRCGPRVWLADARGALLASEDVSARSAALLREGRILGIQGIGAFHLVCDASSASAVAELRRRKRRDAQPFAVMVADAAAAEALASLDADARKALRSQARPIVLAPSRADAGLTGGVNGSSRRTGVMLPYTALHHLLLRNVARPLVVTSANPTGAPVVVAHTEAFARLGGLVDAFLLHDRPIARRVEDSVVTGRRVLRRARGFAPTPIRLPLAAREPVLAVGGHMKNTACLVVGDLAYLTPHLGDLQFVEAEQAWRQEVEGLERLLGVRAEVLAHDLHPDYASTRYALARPARRRIGVQHHVAHVLAAIAEHHVAEPVVGVALDGTGWGPDGTLWGAEILIVDGARWTLVRSLRSLGLAGGERAIRDVWRVALAALWDAYGEAEALARAERLAVFRGVAPEARAAVARMLTAGAAVQARGLGRWFDAIGALALGLPHADFEGQIAVAFDEAADHEPDLASATPYPAAHGETIDLRPTVRAVVEDLERGATAARVAARFHETIATAIASEVARALTESGLRRVVLSGGCMQSERLERSLVTRLGAERVVIAREVPVNDGGIALGQAYAAALAIAGEPT